MTSRNIDPIDSATTTFTEHIPCNLLVIPWSHAARGLLSSPWILGSPRAQKEWAATVFPPRRTSRPIRSTYLRCLSRNTRRSAKQSSTMVGLRWECTIPANDIDPSTDRQHASGPGDENVSSDVSTIYACIW
jgi:hypothetical protein